MGKPQEAMRQAFRRIKHRAAVFDAIVFHLERAKAWHGKAAQPQHLHARGGDNGGCWCMALPPLASADSGGDCLCPACLQRLAATR